MTVVGGVCYSRDDSSCRKSRHWNRSSAWRGLNCHVTSLHWQKHPLDRYDVAKCCKCCQLSTYQSCGYKIDENLSHGSLSSCWCADVRLVGSSNEGRLEVFIDDVWGTVCDTNFDYIDAGVVCNSLGFGLVLLWIITFLSDKHQSWAGTCIWVLISTYVSGWSQQHTLCLKKTTLMLQAISSTHINRFW